MKWAAKQKGFTIVELLIVVVVIAILAAVTIVAYNGITNRAKTSAVQSLALQASKKLATYAITNSDTYPADKTAFLSQTGVSESATTTYQYTASAPYTAYCLTVTSNSISYYVSQATSTPTAGGCPGHGVNGVAAVTNLATNPSFESYSGAAVTGVTSSARATAETDTIGALSGTRSLKVTPLYSTTDTFVLLNDWGIEPNTTYTVMISATLQQPLSSGSTPKFRFSIGSLDGTSGISGTTVGTHHIRWTFTTPDPAPVTFLRLMPGGKVGDPPTYFDNFMVVKGTYTGQYADGSSPNWVWNGIGNGSTSTGPFIL